MSLGVPEDKLQTELAQAQRQIRAGVEPPCDPEQLHQVRELASDDNFPGWPRFIGGLFYLMGYVVWKALPVTIGLALVVFLVRWLI